MIGEFAHYALILALCLAICLVGFTSIGIIRSREDYLIISRQLAYAQFIFVCISFLLLAYAFISNDFSINYVAANSNTHLPLIYRFCAVWGAHEGSLLLWVFILTIWMGAVAMASRQLPVDVVARVLCILSLVAIGFYLLILSTSNPFLRVFTNIPQDGLGLNPLLQDPGLVSHPPILYMGYVGFSVAFAFAIAALWKGELDARWVNWTRPWTLLAWCFLTAGIVLGSWWAYRELGWGGFWFWDPVENASFLPWLVGTALIHSIAVSAKRDVFKAWTVLLAVSAFSLSLMGTFLVRSGVLISVHAFAVDPRRGAFILQFLLIVIGGSLLLYALRGKKLVSRDGFKYWSRESLLLANNIILFIMMLTVLLGTLYPLIIEALGLGKISIGAPYFNLVFIPLMVPLLFLMGFAPVIYWGEQEPRSILKRSVVIFLLSMLLALVLPLLFQVTWRWSVWLALTLAFWILIHLFISLKIRKYTIGMTIAHLGLVVTMLGVVLTSQLSEERDLIMQVGDGIALHGFTYTLERIEPLQGPNYHGITAVIGVEHHKNMVTTLYPELRVYDVEQTALAKTAIYINGYLDLYVALGESLSANHYGIRLYYKPFVRWIWWGGLLMVFGGFTALIERYRRRQIQKKLESQ